MAREQHQRDQIDYILPIRSSTRADDELTTYLRQLSQLVHVIVVDGSAPQIFQTRTGRWNNLVTHVRPAAQLAFANGKVNGVLTGLRSVTAAKIIIADEDVRYDAAGLDQVAALLDTHELVIPQNYFSPVPWHAQWDSARSLLNRLTPGGDFPGTLAVKRTDALVERGYDGDVLFENLELIRTVKAGGGTAHVARGLYVRRLPPDVRHFLTQRVRQAYDSQAQPLRLLGELALVPGALACRRAPQLLVVAALISIAAAEVGRRRAGGRRVFPATSALYAPGWLVERAMCAWLALGVRVGFGGVRYRGARIRLAAHSVRHLRRATIGLQPYTAQPHPGHLVGAVAERLHR